MNKVTPSEVQQAQQSDFTIGPVVQYVKVGNKLKLSHFQKVK